MLSRNLTFLEVPGTPILVTVPKPVPEVVPVPDAGAGLALLAGGSFLLGCEALLFLAGPDPGLNPVPDPVPVPGPVPEIVPDLFL